MSRLSKLYEAMETLRKEGLPVDENLEKKANMNWKRKSSRKRFFRC